jgi:competence protein ComEC
MNFLEKNTKWFYFGIIFLICFNFFVWKEVFYLYKNSELKVNFLNVGQGDSAFVVTPQNHQILIDGGPDSTVLGKIAKQMPFWDKSLDLVILSHPEKDHMQGLIEVLKRYKVNYIVWSGVKKQDAEYLEWLKVLIKQQKMGAKIITAQVEQEIKVGNLLIDILNPKENLFGRDAGSSSNDTSVVAKLIYGKNSFLFTGDIDAKAEADLIAKFSGDVGHPPILSLKSDVLKVAHHGSKYSTTDIFLESVKPSAAVIEVGKNTYGHPTPEAILRLKNIGAKILRTDQLGDIVFKSNGQNLFLLK